MIYSLLFLLCFSEEVGILLFFPMTSEVDISLKLKSSLLIRSSQTSAWLPGTVVKNNNPFHTYTALHLTEGIQISKNEDFGVRHCRVLTPALPPLPGRVTLPLSPSLSVFVNGGVSGPHQVRVKYMMDQWWTFLSCLPSVPFCLLSLSFCGIHVFLGTLTPPKGLALKHVT